MSATPAAPPPSVGRLVIGPTALGDDPRRFWNLTITLAVTDFKLKFFGSVLGYLWQLMKPLMLFRHRNFFGNAWEHMGTHG